MSQTNQNNPGQVNDDLGNSEMDQQLQSSQSSDTSEQADNPLTHSSDDDDANESNAARNAADGGDHDAANTYRDRNRGTSTRANEASDRLDSGSGGLGSGGGHSAGEIK